MSVDILKKNLPTFHRFALKLSTKKVNKVKLKFDGKILCAIEIPRLTLSIAVVVVIKFLSADNVSTKNTLTHRSQSTLSKIRLVF